MKRNIMKKNNPSLLTITVATLATSLALSVVGCSKQQADNSNKPTKTEANKENATTNQTQKSDTDSANVIKQQKSFTADVYNQQIKPNIVNAQLSAQTMSENINKFCAEPNEQGFKDVQTSWKNTMHAWTKAWVIKIPSLNQPSMRDRMYIYAYPDSRKLTQTNLDRLLKEDIKFDAQWAENANIRPLGLMGLEYMLFAKITKWQDVQTHPKFCDLIKAQAHQLHTDIKDRAELWTTEYGQTFANSTEDFAQKDATITAWYNNLLQLARFMQEQKLAKPAGLNEKGMVKDHFESPYAKISLELYKTSFDLLKTGVLGSQKEDDKQLGLVDYMKTSQSDNKNTQQVIEDLQAEFTVVNKILTSFKGTELSSQNKVDLEALNDATKAIVSTLKDQVSQQMNVPITFNDADGD